MYRRLLSSLVLCLALVACDSPDERAERYYQSALSLLEEGDTNRALLELRNVFDHDGFHLEARALYARLLVETGDMQQAYSQYLRLVEQDPDRVDARLTLADMAIDRGDWQEVERHATAAHDVAPEDPTVQAYMLMLDYRTARLARDDVTAGAHVTAIQALLDKDPDIEVAQRLMIDWLASGTEPERALPYVDQILASNPNAFGIHMVRLSILSRQENAEAIETQLRDMYQRFPDNPTVAEQLIRWYASRQEFDEVEEFLRERAGPDDANFEDHVAVVQVLQQTQGRAAAEAELLRLADANVGSDLGRRYALMALVLKLDAQNAGETETGILALIDEIEDADLRNEARIVLVRLRAGQGNSAGAQEVLAQILESDASNVQGLLLRAATRIQSQMFGEAISDLRTALDQSPRNPDVLLLLAEAHQKLGNVELAEQRLARAVEVSGAGPRETLLFARFQIGRGNLVAADQVLTESLRSSGDLEVAHLLAQVQLQRGDFDGVESVIAQLTASDNAQAARLAQELQATLLFNQNRVQESLNFLRSTLDDDLNEAGGNFETDVQILRVQMMSGRLDEARDQLRKLRGQYPNSLALRLLQGNILSLEGNTEAAIAVYRQILTENPNELLVIQRLYAALRDSGQEVAASELLVRAIETQPEARSLQMLRAMELETQGAHEDAIAIYEQLYANNPNDIVVANNLASVLAYYRNQDVDLDRAHRIALQLSGSNRPEFQDTLGYIQLRRGETDNAILNLQAAARGLPNNATIAFNLALAYAAADRVDDAREELSRGFELAGRRTDIPQLGRARLLAEELDLPPENRDL